MEKRIVIPRIVVWPILPPPLEIGARIQPQWLHWQVGRYREKLSFGPGGEGKAKIWVPEREGEQHNLILTQFYDSLIPQYGFVGSSQFAAVGTGSTAPDPSQTQLANEIGTSSSPRRTNFVPAGSSNEIEALATYGEYNIRRVFEFTEAQVGGLNLTEWGFSPVGSYNGPLMTRELFQGRPWQSYCAHAGHGPKVEANLPVQGYRVAHIAAKRIRKHWRRRAWD
jgi:hypothetical protein